MGGRGASSGSLQGAIRIAKTAVSVKAMGANQFNKYMQDNSISMQSLRHAEAELRQASEKALRKGNVDQWERLSDKVDVIRSWIYREEKRRYFARR